MPLGPTTIISTIGAGIGGLCGFAVGGPSCMVDGAKIGLGLGLQVGVVNKAENAVDHAGRKIEEVGNKAIDAMDEAKQKLINTIESIAHTWSTLLLSGYVAKIAFNGVAQNEAIYNEYCKSALQSVNCVSMSLTTISLDMIAVSTIACVAYKMLKLLKNTL